ncbi:MAG: hypothetical protein OEZ41_02800 [Nitrospirota bacterium]|nr:hypothetical protein [Nitrospirota bacterium]MDH5698873.1 hypothetical protein [Nitrospirota bacterium]
MGEAIPTAIMPDVFIGHPSGFPIGMNPRLMPGGLTENVGHLRHQPVSGIHHEP